MTGAKHPPAGGFKSIPTAWWLTADFLGLNALEQRLLVMLWTAPTTPLCGIVELAPEHWASRLRVTPRAVRSALGGLHNAGFVDFEVTAPMVCLIGHIEAQLRGLPTASPLWLKNTVRALDRMPETAVTKRFRERYGLPKSEATRKGSPKGLAKGSRKGIARGAPNRNRKGSFEAPTDGVGVTRA